MIAIPAYTEAFAANGTSGGIIQVVSSRVFWPGSVAYIQGDALSGIKVIIVEATDSTHIRVKLHPEEGASDDNKTTRYVAQTVADLTLYTMAANAAIVVPAQQVFQMPDGGVIPKLPSYWN